MTVVLVSNPSSGGADQSTLEAIEDRLRTLGEVVAVEPSSVETIEREVAPLIPEATHVVVAGGDGTLSCVVNALAERLDEVVFGLVPMGTGNDLARTLGIPEDPLEAARVVVAGRETPVDVGRASGAGVDRLFVNACMGGFPVEVDAAIDEETKARLGPVAFWIGGVKALSDLTRFRAVVNGTTIDDCVAVGVGNGRTAGGGIEVFPDADPHDSLLDACALPAAGAGAIVKLAAKVRSGGHQAIDEVAYVRAREITIETNPVVEFNVDGEVVGLKAPVRFEITGRLRLVSGT